MTLTRTGGAAAASVTLSTSDGTASTVPPFAAALAGTDYEALSSVGDFAEGRHHSGPEAAAAIARESTAVPIAFLPGK